MVYPFRAPKSSILKKKIKNLLILKKSINYENKNLRSIKVN